MSFLYGAQKLELDKTLEEQNITPPLKNKIVVNDVFNLIGAGGPLIDFVDVSNGNTRKLVISHNAPRWREIGKGLNIFGICQNPKCDSWKKEVVYKTKLNDKLVFILNDEILNIICPICLKIIKVKTCGFYKCEYQFEGKMIKEGELKNYDSKAKETHGNDFEYFDAFENGEIQWKELTIYVLPKQGIKYKIN